MKHLKLFESFNNDEKIDLANSYLIEYLLFKYFINNDILVEKNYASTDVEYGFWYKYKIGRCCFFKYLPNKSEVLLTQYTEYNLIRAFQGYINEMTINDVKRRLVSKERSTRLGVLGAVKKYISYLTNTPEKKHLLQE